MQCMYCGGFVEPRHKFCLNCGRSIRNQINGESSIHPKSQATMSFKCPECSSKLLYNKRVFRFWCDICRAYRYPDPDYYDFSSLKMSKNLYYHLGEQTITDVPCPICNSKTHFDHTFGTYWCDYCNRYTQVNDQIIK
jgi:DNA-directed RNA polymerase subunit RPC12/RpoP